MQAIYPKSPGIYRIIINDKSYIGATLNLRARINKHKSYLKNNTHSNTYLQNSYNKFNKVNFEILEILDTNDREILLDYETFYHKKYDSIENGYNLDYPRKIQSRFHLKQDQIIKANDKKRKKVMIFDRYNGSFIMECESVSEAARFVNTSSSNISRICNGKMNHIKGYTYCYSSDYSKLKNYSFPYNHAKGVNKSEEHKMKMKLNSFKAKRTYVYDANYELKFEFRSRRECEEFFEFTKESLRRYVDKETPFNGYYFKHTKI